MGKLLDMLRQGEGGTVPVLPLPSRPVAAAEVLPLHASAESQQPEDEYLYIEVGGPGKKLDASPCVLATAARETLPGPALPVESKSPPVAAPVLRPAQPMSVAFESWPAKGQPASYVAPEIITYHQPDHPASKQYAELCAKVTDGLGKTPVLLFSGAAEKSGTTTVLLNLAFSASRQGCRVAVVEGNLAQPALAERLGLEAAAGWHEFLSGQVGLEKAVQPTAQPRLFALVAGTGARDSVLSPEAYRWVLGWLRQRFDLLLIDAPNVGDQAALATLLPASDGIYLVLPQTASESSQLGDTAQSIIRMGGRLRGLIHTQFESL
jgi:Mrp family chromosome partitioning ATPase